MESDLQLWTTMAAVPSGLINIVAVKAGLVIESRQRCQYMCVRLHAAFIDAYKSGPIQSVTKQGRVATHGSGLPCMLWHPTILQHIIVVQSRVQGLSCS